MNILFLCHRLPYPPNKGDKIRSYNLLAHLAKRHTVYLGTFVDAEEDWQFVAKVQTLLGRARCQTLRLPGWLKIMRMVRALLCGEPLSTGSFRSTKLAKWVRTICSEQRIDAVIVFGSAMAPYMLDNSEFPSDRVIFDMVDIDSDKWAQYGAERSGIMKWIYNREAASLFRLEEQAARKFGATLLVSPHETKTFAEMVPDITGRLFTCRNGVDLSYFDSTTTYPNPFPATPAIVMTGRMDYRPNAEGALWFAKNALPKILSIRPDAKFYVVGARPTSAVRSLASENVIVTGSVSDIRPYIANAHVVVAPLQIARGVQNKVLEAMALKKPVVATSLATRALDVTHGHEVFIADEPAYFADTVLAVLDCRHRPTELAANARRHVDENYGWAQNLAIFDRLLVKVGSPNAPMSPQISSASALVSATGR